MRLSFLGERTAGGGVACLHGESECVGNKAQLCTHKHWPSHVDVDDVDMAEAHPPAKAAFSAIENVPPEPCGFANSTIVAASNHTLDGSESIATTS